jgi:hypothetical protein
MSRNPILTRIKLASNDSVFAERSTNFLANLTNRAVRVELLSNGACGGDDAGVLGSMLVGRYTGNEGV